MGNSQPGPPGPRGPPGASQNMKVSEGNGNEIVFNLDNKLETNKYNIGLSAHVESDALKFCKSTDSDKCTQPMDIKIKEWMPIVGNDIQFCPDGDPLSKSCTVNKIPLEKKPIKSSGEEHTIKFCPKGSNDSNECNAFKMQTGTTWTPKEIRRLNKTSGEEGNIVLVDKNTSEEKLISVNIKGPPGVDGVPAHALSRGAGKDLVKNILNSKKSEEFISNTANQIAKALSSEVGKEKISKDYNDISSKFIDGIASYIMNSSDIEITESIGHELKKQHYWVDKVEEELAKKNMYEDIIKDVASAEIVSNNPYKQEIIDMMTTKSKGNFKKSVSGRSDNIISSNEKISLGSKCDANGKNCKFMSPIDKDTRGIYNTGMKLRAKNNYVKLDGTQISGGIHNNNAKVNSIALNPIAGTVILPHSKQTMTVSGNLYGKSKSIVLKGSSKLCIGTPSKHIAIDRRANLDKIFEHVR